MPYGSLLADVVQSSATGTPPQFNDTTGTQIGTLCRAWVNFNGTGTVAIRASFNVSSITDNGTGDYTVNFTNALVDANYAAVATANQNAAGNPAGFSIGYPDNNSTITYSTTQVRFLVKFGSSSSVFDAPTVSVAIFR
jgi:hypothetical protein